MNSGAASLSAPLFSLCKMFIAVYSKTSRLCLLLISCIQAVVCLLFMVKSAYHGRIRWFCE